MATLLELANRVVPEIGFPDLATIVGNTSQLARQVLALANREGRSLAKHDWRILIKRNVITTVSSAESYSLPSDFDRFIHGTEWNESDAQRMTGPTHDQTWQADLSGLTMVTVNDRFQVRADGANSRIFIRPVPTSAESITFFYACSTWCKSNGGQRQSQWLADNDVLLLDDFVFELGLKWRLLQAQKRAYAEEQAEYDREKKKRMALDGGLETLRLLGPFEDWSPQANVGEANFGS